MMKDRSRSGSSTRARRGAALVLVTAASAVVLLSTLLLLGYLGRMSRIQTSREIAAQAGLSSSGAADWLAWSLTDGGSSPAGLDGSRFRSGGLVTQISLMEEYPVPPASIPIPHSSEPGTEAIPSGGAVSLLTPCGDSLSVIFFDIHAGSSTQLPGIPNPGNAIAAGTGDASGWLFALIDHGEGASVRFIDLGGEVAVSMPPVLPDWAVAEAGTIDGIPAVVLYSDSGPCMALLRDGTVLSGEDAARAAFGLDHTGPAASSGESPADLLRCDIDMDGSEDIVLILPWAVLCMTRPGIEAVDSVPGASPSAWGFSSISSGPVVCWEGESGRTWRRFGWTGFQNFDPVAALSSGGWEGRFVEGFNCIAGRSNGLRIASCSSGATRLLLAGTPFLADLDPGGPDALVRSGDGWSIMLDPLGGDGTGTRWSLVTRSASGVIRSDTLSISVYMDEGGSLYFPGVVQ